MTENCLLFQSVGFTQDSVAGSRQACIQKKQELVAHLESYRASLNATLDELENMEKQGKYTVNRNAKVATYASGASSAAGAALAAWASSLFAAGGTGTGGMAAGLTGVFGVTVGALVAVVGLIVAAIGGFYWYMTSGLR